MAAPTKPTDLYVVNGWYIELPGLISPHFETLGGLGKNSETVSIVDAGSNKRYKFGGQIVDFGDLSLSRTLQGTPDDIALDALFDQMVYNGLKVNAVVVKKHKGQIVFNMLLEGFRFVSRGEPTQDVNSSEKYIQSFSATCDDVTKI